MVSADHSPLLGQDADAGSSDSLPCGGKAPSRGRGHLTRRRKMSRRTNLIGLCTGSILCIFLLLITQHRPPLPASLVSTSAAGSGSAAALLAANDRHGLYNNNGQQQSVLVVYNLTATIKDVLNAERAKVATEMENFEYPAGRFGVDAEKLSDLTLATGGEPVRSLILTSWRSGSTFLGEILNAMPANYYHYEPLLDFGIKQVRGAADAVMAVQNLKNLLNCEYEDLDEYLDYGKSHTYLFEHNERLWSVCKEFPHYCWRAKFLSPLCKLFPFQSMKTVRLRLANANQLLDDKRRYPSGQSILNLLDVSTTLKDL